MALEISCACGKRLHAPKQLAGKLARCPGCGAAVRVPAAATAAAPGRGSRAPDVRAPAAARHAARRASAPTAAGDDAGYEIKDAFDPTPRRRVPAAAAGDGAAGDDAAPPTLNKRACPMCKTPMGGGDICCPKCRFSPLTNTYVAGGDRPSAGKGPRPWLSLMGIDFTTGRVAVLALALATLVGLVAWWVTGPGAKLRVLDAQVVDATRVIDSVELLEAGSLFNGNFFTSAPSAGVHVGTQAEAVTPLDAPDGEVHGAAPDGRPLMLTRAAADGEFLLVRLALAQSLLEDSGSTAGHYDVIIRENDFALDINGERIAPLVMLVRPLVERAVVSLSDSRNGDYRAVLPPQIEPTEREVEVNRETNMPARGSVRYDGSAGVTGEVRFVSYYAASGGAPGSGGLGVDGNLTWKHPRGFDIDYRYTGGVLDVKWNAEAQGWRGAAAMRQERSLSPWTKYGVALVFPRPASARRATLLYRDQPWTSVRVPAGSTGSPPKVAQAREAAPPEAPQPGVVEQANYLGALANAHQRGKAVAALANMQQIAVSIRLYTDTHGPPADFEAVGTYVHGFDQLLLNPRTGENPGFAFAPFTAQDLRTKPAGAIPVVYQIKDGQVDLAGPVGYLDGHVEEP